MKEQDIFSRFSRGEVSSSDFRKITEKNYSDYVKKFRKKRKVPTRIVDNLNEIWKKN